MRGYFGAIARLALGKGSLVEPRIQTAFEEGFTILEVEQEPGGATVVGTASAIHSPSAGLPQQPRIEQNLYRIEQGLPPIAPEKVAFGTEAIDGPRERLAPIHTMELQVKQESIRELLRESTFHTAHSAETRENLRSEVRIESKERSERMVTRSEQNVEVRSQIERLIREIQAPAASRMAARTDGATQIDHEENHLEEPTVEIHIGRVEVRATPAERGQRSDPKQKPKGAIDLNEYLRDRSRGAL